MLLIKFSLPKKSPRDRIKAWTFRFVAIFAVLALPLIACESTVSPHPEATGQRQPTQIASFTTAVVFLKSMPTNTALPSSTATPATISPSATPVSFTETLVEPGGQDWATGVTVTRHELEWGLVTWVGIQESQANQQHGLMATLCAKGDLADQNLIPSLAGGGGEWKAMFSVVIIEPDGMAALMRPPGQIAPLVDLNHPEDNLPFELYVRNLGPGTNAAQHVLKCIQDWNRAGRPTSARWQIRAIPPETEYHPTDGETLVNKPWTKLILRYQ